jgi:hypothetical protein
MNILANLGIGNGASNASKPVEKPVDPTANEDQQLAALRDQLVARGKKISGWGITGERVEWASDVLQYAFRVSAGKKTEFIKAIDYVHQCINAHSGGFDMSDKNGRDATLHMSIKLAMICAKAPQVKFLDWGVASMFSRFLRAYNPAQPELEFEPECIALASKIALRDQSFLTKRGGIDKVKVKNDIKRIFGDAVEDEKNEVSKSDDGENVALPEEPTVTSEEAVAQWLLAASDEQLDVMFKIVGKAKVTHILNHIMPRLANY